MDIDNENWKCLLDNDHYSNMEMSKNQINFENLKKKLPDNQTQLWSNKDQKSQVDIGIQFRLAFVNFQCMCHLNFFKFIFFNFKNQIF